MEQHELQLLLLSLGETRYGIDIDQIASLTNSQAAQSAVRFEQLLGIDPFADYGYPKTLLIKQKLQTPILISEPEEVATFNVSDIRILPASLAIPAGNKGIWGL